MESFYLKFIYLHVHIQGFFQALCYTTVFVFQIEFLKSQRIFFYAKDIKKSAEGLQSTVSPPVDPGQSPGGGPRDKALGSSAYLDFENLLLQLKICLSFFVNHCAIYELRSLLGVLFTFVYTQSTFTCSKLTMETLEQDVKYVQS